MAPSLSADVLTAELAAHGLHVLIGTEPAPATPRLTPAELLAALAQQRDARLRSALIALLLDQPALADATAAALALLDGPAQQMLMLYYTAAVILQGNYAARLRPLAQEWRTLPDRFAAALDLPAEQNPDVRLAQLGQRQREITGPAANWVGAYEYAAQRYLRRREKEARWAA
jgi:hypothetical protein